jgi:hypothetical protein
MKKTEGRKYRDTVPLKKPPGCLINDPVRVHVQNVETHNVDTTKCRKQNVDLQNVGNDKTSKGSFLKVDLLLSSPCLLSTSTFTKSAYPTVPYC